MLSISLRKKAFELPQITCGLRYNDIQYVAPTRSEPQSKPKEGFRAIMPSNELDMVKHIEEFQKKFATTSEYLQKVASIEHVSPYPFVVDPVTLTEANKLHQTLYRALNAVVGAYFHDSRIREILQLSAKAEAVLRQTNPESYSPGSFRPDIIIDNQGAMHVCEINARFSTNGFFISYGLNQMLSDLSYASTFAPIPSLHQTPKVFSDFFDANFPIVILKGREPGGDIHFAADSLRSKGYSVRFARPESLYVHDEKLYDEQGVIDQTILELHQDEIEALSFETLSALARLRRSLNDLRTVFIVHDKRLLAVLRDENIMGELLNHADCARLRAHIIQTDIVSRLSTEMALDVRQNREHWLIKPSRSGKGAGIIFGRNLSEQAWKQLLESAEYSEYVIQRVVLSQKLQVINPITTLSQSQNIIGAMLCFGNHFLGFGIFRAASSDVVNLHGGGCVVSPALPNKSYTQPIELMVEDKLFGNTYARIIKLSDTTREAWRNRILMFLRSGKNSLAKSLSAAAQMPEMALETILSITDNPCGSPAILLRNLPIDLNLPPTPLDGGDAPEGTPVADNVLLGIARLLGQPIGFKGLKNGSLVQTIAPTLSGGDSMSNEGAKQRFNFHVESAFSMNRASHLMLLCLRSDHDGVAQTELVDAQSAYHALSENTKKILRQPLFITMAPETFKDVHKKQIYCDPRPIITGPEETPEVCFNLQTTRGLSKEAQEAFEALENELMKKELILSIKLRPGDLMLFDNRRVLHARTPFSARLDGTDRWLRRLYVGPDLWAVRSANEKTHRELDPMQMPWNYAID